MIDTMIIEISLIKQIHNVIRMFCLFVWSCTSNFSAIWWLSQVPMTLVSWAANLDLCFALTAFSSEGSFTCHTYCDTGPRFLRSCLKDPCFSLLNAVLLAKEQSLPVLNVLGLTWLAWVGLKLTTSSLLSKSTTTRLRQPVRLARLVLHPLGGLAFSSKRYGCLFPSHHLHLSIQNGGWCKTE
jgi:hypothetical protein